MSRSKVQMSQTRLCPKRIWHKGAKTLKPRFICIVNDVLVKN